MNRFQKKRLFHPKASAQGGRRADGIYYRSRWEKNVSVWLDELKRRGEVLEWLYEKREFTFPVKRGTRFYKPDFWVREQSIEYFIEVKGFLDAKSVTALKRMQLYYPEVTVLLLDKRRYAALESEFGSLDGWEK